MKSRIRYLPPALLLLGLIAVGFYTGHSDAQMTTKQEPADSAVKRLEAGTGDSLGATGWLHVDVETSYGWFWQKSVGRAWLTAGREGGQPIKAAKLCVRLIAHDSTEKCVAGKDSVIIVEQKKGLGIPRRLARVVAWSVDPTRDTTSVQLMP